MTHSDKGPVLFFDGVCNLCNRSVQFVIRHDRQAKIKFATLQSALGETAKKAVIKSGNKVPDSLILYADGKYDTESTAALKLGGYLDGGWKLLSLLLVIPAFIRHPVYRFIARNRYKWMGKKEECMVPAPDLAARFLS